MAKNNNDYRFKRGDICQMADPLPKKKHPSYYLVMRVIDPCSLLAVPIYEKCEKNATIDCKLSIGNYKIRYPSLQKYDSSLFKKCDGVVLYSAREVVGDVYVKRKEYLRQKYVKSIEKKMESRRISKELKELHRLREYDLGRHKPNQVPLFISQNAKHPYQGGLVSPR